MDTSSFASSPPSTARALSRRIARLDASADVKALLADLARITVTVGNRLLAIGRMILDLGLALTRAFPHTIFAVVVAVVMAMLIASIPFIGPLLGTIAGPLLLALGLGVGAVHDMAAGDLGVQVRGFVDALERRIAEATA
ncbi:hypothetical protein OCH239_13795 [Roseivivax halodurans JCM 10272]|uniref:Uncharacterized protein n=1 Tax=Roseivivax halodurans JCM 10272 TaxID=1449350 RepID=X7EI24_9RHOB|nr:hypothetical protein OCH239_13795 [Roseivivax halodurans JCM 10272]